jgi:hypothetical protein
MAHVDRVREEAIARIMHTFEMDRADAESIVDRSEGRFFDLDDGFSLGEESDIDISEQVTRLIHPRDELDGE